MEGHPLLNKCKPLLWGMAIGLVWMVGATWVWAREVNQLQSLKVRPLPNQKIEVQLEFSKTIETPKSFTVEAPPSLVFDFNEVKSALPKDWMNHFYKNKLINSIQVVEAEHKTRLVLDVQETRPFEIVSEGSKLNIVLDETPSLKTEKRSPLSKMSAYHIKGVDFRRGSQGEAKLIVDLSNAKGSVDIKEEKGKIFLHFIGASIAEKLAKRYDVVDFGTAAQTLEVSQKAGEVDMVIETLGQYHKMAYQVDNQFILDIREASSASASALKKSSDKYTGDKLSLNFQNIEVRAVLQTLADFSGFNLIVGDSVKGNITLRLQEVPWDQALDIILQTKELDKRQIGNVLLVAPATEIAAREKAELEGKKNLEELGPLKSELIQVNYAVADNLASLLKDKANSLLTSRGNVTVDKRTNTLLVQDIEPKLAEIRALLLKLDIPIRQVEISTQIVTADNTLESTLGMRFGGGANLGVGHRRLGVGSGADRARVIADYQNPLTGKSGMPPSNYDFSGGTVNNNIAQGAYNQSSPTVNNSEGLFSDFGAQTSGSTFTAAGLSPAKLGLALAKLPNGTLLDLELQAMEYESKSKTIARPKIVTMDQNKATVEQGVDIPYAQSTSSGAASVAYKTAALKLEVTPQITPDDKVSLDLVISNDALGQILAAGPVVNTNRMQTKVLVDNGETVVLGGVLNISDTKSWAKVPFFGDLPVLGSLFRNRYARYSPKELIIFLTPRIMTPLASLPPE